MTDTTIRDTVRRLLEFRNSLGSREANRLDDELATIEDAADALAAENAKLRAYANDLEWQWAPHLPVGSGGIADLRAKHGVTELMRD